MVSPLFIIGSGRSGTSILSWSMGQHSNIMVLPETYWTYFLTYPAVSLFHMCRDISFSHLAKHQIEEEDFLPEIGEAFYRIIQKGFNKALAIKEGENVGPFPFALKQKSDDPKKRWVDATPQNTYAVHGLLKIFPQAKFIHLLRHPLEVANSFEHFSKKYPGAPQLDFHQALKDWMDKTDFAYACTRALREDQSITITYNDLCSKTEETLKSIFSFAGENFEEATLAPWKNTINSSSKTLSDERRSIIENLPDYNDALSIYEKVLTTPKGPPSINFQVYIQNFFEKFIAQAPGIEGLIQNNKRTQKFYRGEEHV